MWDWAKSIVRKCIIVNGVLMCLTSTNGKVSHAVLVLKCLCKQILRLAHDSPGLIIVYSQLVHQ